MSGGITGPACTILGGIILSTENLTATLIKKMEAEQDRYRAWLTDQPPAEILKNTREYVIRENILIALKERDLTTPQAEMLLSSTSPLADIYQDWSKQHKYGSGYFLSHYAQPPRPPGYVRA